MAITLDGTTGITTPGLTNTGTETIVSLTTTGNTTLGDATSDTLAVGVTGIVKDASGNVGIGTATPRTSKLDVMSATGTQNTSGDGSGLVNITGPNGANGSQPIFVIATNDALAANIGPAITFQARYLTSSTAAATLGYIQCLKENATSNNLQGALTFVPRNSAGNFVEAGRFDSSSNLLVGLTSGAGERLAVVASSGNATMSVQVSANGNSGVNFKNVSSTTVGQIVVNSSTTAYNTSSDYRLKENIQSMAGALAKVAALKPVTYKWKLDGSNGEGFIAHELQEVVPDCVTGEKDAVETYTDEDGNEQTRPKYQGIDTSFLVATLTAAIQEQQALITALTARITALETP